MICRGRRHGRSSRALTYTSAAAQHLIAFSANTRQMAAASLELAKGIRCGAVLAAIRRACVAHEELLRAGPEPPADFA